MDYQARMKKKFVDARTSTIMFNGAAQRGLTQKLEEYRQLFKTLGFELGLGQLSVLMNHYSKIDDHVHFLEVFEEVKARNLDHSSHIIGIYLKYLLHHGKKEEAYKYFLVKVNEPRQLGNVEQSISEHVLCSMMESASRSNDADFLEQCYDILKKQKVIASSGKPYHILLNYYSKGGDLDLNKTNFEEIYEHLLENDGVNEITVSIRLKFLLNQGKVEEADVYLEEMIKLKKVNHVVMKMMLHDAEHRGPKARFQKMIEYGKEVLK